MSRSGAPLRLITIGFSHYCEKARWALDHAGLDYVEDDHVPILHFAANRAAGAKRTVPALVTPRGVLGESSDILRFADEHLPGERKLFPAEPALRAEVERLVTLFDRSLGPAVRRVAYAHMFGDRGRTRDLVTSTGPAWERRIGRLLTVPMQALMRRALGLYPGPTARSQARLDEIYVEVAALLQDGRRFLVGDRFTAADLTFAALSGPALMTPRYGYPLPLDRLTPAAADWAARTRATPAGQFALRLFTEERPPVRAQGRSDMSEKTG
ncbi:glutathione S-transferase family protein [Nannocystis bainbridge]|uniref:Glutathione S-transferase n=1 Tax=Nannocystis bainbridge TaxID=2995303 RepID=A0ABT5E9B2_9BACT|nr:glutathione S-transferase family protein [Nannocystis bainbridge]MDC0722038.1 glutathione S-transferase [Nannocystis bainbridge]